MGISTEHTLVFTVSHISGHQWSSLIRRGLLWFCYIARSEKLSSIKNIVKGLVNLHCISGACQSDTIGNMQHNICIKYFKSAFLQYTTSLVISGELSLSYLKGHSNASTHPITIFIIYHYSKCIFKHKTYPLC
jgi:hypothetical protein